MSSSEIEKLPIAPFLDDICEKIKSSASRFLLLTAETAAGKSTALPVALLKHFDGNILMLEPRRLAVLNIASRVSDLLGEECGKTCGYQMHLENKISSQTRAVILTEAILTRKLQNDPLLEGVSVVVIDEFHERSIHADLALSFLKEAVQMRDDLFVVVMSATIEAERISAYLDNCPVYKVPGRQFPVEVKYNGNISVTDAVISELKNFNVQQEYCNKENKTEQFVRNSILVFLPGIFEIRKVKTELEEKNCEAEILILHSSISFDEQKKVLSPVKDLNSKRVILSSAIAETSLSVPGISTVIDCGEARINLFNTNAGMETLVTRRESKFNAEQRKGRAGRLGPGKCLRLWNENEILTEETPPEILRTDLCSLVLECAEWGVTSADKLQWLDNPPKEAWTQAKNLLKLLGCINEDDEAITKKGKAVLTMGLHPRLACVALSGRNEKEITESLELVLKYSSYAEAASFVQKNFKADLQRRIEKANRFLLEKNQQNFTECNLSVLLLEGFPDRIAVRKEIIREKNIFAQYQFMSGRAANLFDEKQIFPEYIIAPVVDAGERSGKIFAYEAIEKSAAEKWLSRKAKTFTKTYFEEDGKKLLKKEICAYGKIIISEKKLTADPEDFCEAVCNSVEENGIEWLPLNEGTKKFLERVKFYLDNVENFSGIKMSEEKNAELKNKFLNLQFSAKEWLVPFLTEKNSLNANNIYNALSWYLESEEINKFVPVEIKLANGKKRKIIYEDQNGKIIPVLEVIIQHIFGCMETPSVLGVPVLLKLLSPARRPLQITNDLENFWKETWPEICKEMKGRYPKHNWDYRIVSEDD